MPIQLEVSYFNSFIISNSTAAAPGVIVGKWYVEESRIKGKYNGNSVDYGVRAYATDTDYTSRREGNSMIYSGIYNPRTGINKTNEFPTGAEITRSLDPKYGTIQKLFAEDNELDIFQETKVHRALIDKDAIYTATGSQLITATNKVIGSITPYQAAHGISTHPESHAYYNGRQYFANKNKGAVLRLSDNGIVPISDYGKKSDFRKYLKNADYIRGMFDERRSEYVLCIGKEVDADSDISVGKKTVAYDFPYESMKYVTIGFYEPNNGWSSRYTYKPRFGFSFRNEFYTFGDTDLYKHYSELVPRCSFYGGLNDPAYITLAINDAGTESKNFLSVNYEGTTGWEIVDIACEDYSEPGYDVKLEAAYKIPKEGVIITNEQSIPIPAGFVKKENEFYAPILSKENDFFNDLQYAQTSGLKGHVLDLTIISIDVNNTPAVDTNRRSVFTVSANATSSYK